MNKTIICPCGQSVTMTDTQAIPWHLVGEYTPCAEVGMADPAIRLVSAEERAERRALRGGPRKGGRS